MNFKKLLLTFCSVTAFAMMVCSCEKDDPVEETQTEEETLSRLVTITFHSNDGAGETRTVTTRKSRLIAEPCWYPSNKSGYTFAGWCTDEEGTQLFDFDNTKPKTDLSLYASYSRDIILTNMGKVAQVTGSQVDTNIPSPNHTSSRWQVGSTDLGIIYEISEGKYGVFFGDTFSGYFTGDWRSNVLAYSENTDFENGLIFSGMYVDSSNPGRAKPVIERNNYLSFTYIPTAAITINGNQYMHFMYWQVGDRSHDTENYSSFMCCKASTGVWESCKDKISFAYDSYFGMVGLAKRDGDPYCYMMGTQTGPGYRTSVAKLARFKPEDILDETKYTYWNGTKGLWLEGEENASTVLDGTVGELSLLYLEKYGRWVVMYFDSASYAICYRSAARLNGPWSEEHILCSGNASGYHQLYGSYMHPLCGKNGSDDIYWTMSLWGPYNVFWMKATVSYVK